MEYICQLGNGRMLGIESGVVNVVSTGYPLPDCKYNGVVGQLKILESLGILDSSDALVDFKSFMETAETCDNMPLDEFIGKFKGYITGGSSKATNSDDTLHKFFKPDVYTGELDDWLRCEELLSVIPVGSDSCLLVFSHTVLLNKPPQMAINFKNRLDMYLKDDSAKTCIFVLDHPVMDYPVYEKPDDGEYFIYPVCIYGINITTPIESIITNIKLRDEIGLKPNAKFVHSSGNTFVNESFNKFDYDYAWWNINGDEYEFCPDSYMQSMQVWGSYLGKDF